MKIFFFLWMYLSFCQHARTSDKHQSIKITHPKVKIIIKTSEKIKRSTLIHGTMHSYSDDHKSYSKPIKILLKKRGSSSKFFSKKQYLIKTVDNNGESKKQPLLQMPKHSSWVLYGPYVDRSFIRNTLVYHVGQKIGEEKNTYFAPRWRYLELIVNDNYLGLYIMVEKIKIGKHRVSIKKTKNKNCDFPFLLKIASKNKNFKTRLGTEIKYVYPNQHKIHLQQKNYIQYKIEELDQLFSNIDKNTNLKELEKKISLDSFIDYIIIQEVFKNIDGYRRSAYFYKNNQNLYAMGPLWDFNLAAGNLKLHGMQNPEGFVMTQKHLYFKNAFWFLSLWNNKHFRTRCRQRYLALRSSYHFLSENYLSHAIDVLYENIKVQADTDLYLWNKSMNVLTKKILNTKQKGHFIKDHIAILKHWIFARLTWLDKNI